MKNHFGQIHVAATTIWKTSLEVLKNGAVTLILASSHEKFEAIEKLGMTPGSKVFMKFKKNSWDDVWRLHKYIT